jgi:hypothetical protein
VTDYTKLEPHPLALLLPAMTEDEFKSLVDDIRANGLRVSIMTYQEKILDGLHRYKALVKIGHPLTEKEFTEFKPNGSSDTPLKFVISQNINRRHLNESQRAVIAASITTTQKGMNRFTPKDGSIDTSTAAGMLNVGEASVKRAKKFIEKAPPQFVEKVKQGTMRVSVLSSKELDKSHDEQIKIVADAEAEKANPNLSDKVDELVKSLLAVLKKMQDDPAKTCAENVVQELKRARYIR